MPVTLHEWLTQLARAGDQGAAAALTDPDKARVWFAERRMARDPVAYEIAGAAQRADAGPDPMREEPCTGWPDEIALVDVPRSAPIYGWRMWSITDNGTLTAPYMIEPLNRAGRGAAGTWRRGPNYVSASYCRRPAGAPRVAPHEHPSMDC
jgi:hypothetical protein